MKFKKSYICVKALLSFIVLFAFTLTGCSSNNSNNSAAASTEIPITESQSPAVTESPRDADISVQPFLKYAATEEIVSSVNYYGGGLDFTDADFIETNADDIDLLLMEYKDNINSTGIYIGEYVFYESGDPSSSIPDWFISHKGEPVENAFGYIDSWELTRGFSFSTEDFFANGKGAVFGVGTNYLICISDDEIGAYQLSNMKLSENKKFIVIKKSSGSPSQGVDYVIYSFDDMGASEVSISSGVFESTYLNFNSIIGNDGQFVMYDGVIPNGVATEWEIDAFGGGSVSPDENCSYQIFVTGYKVANVYKSAALGIPCFVDNTYLVFTDQFRLHKLDSNGDTELLKYADFENRFFSTRYNYLEDFHCERGQMVFSEESISDGCQVYIYDCKALKLSKGQFVEDKSDNSYSLTGDFVITE